MLRLDPTFVAQAVEGVVESDQLNIIRQFKVRDPLIQQLGLALKTELETNGASSRLYAESAANFLSLHLVRRYSSSSFLKDNAEGLSASKLRRVMEFIQENLAKDLSLLAIAREAGMSQSHLSRLFKRSMSISVYQYVMQCRIERAIQLLPQKNLAIADIARQVGFADQSHLTRQFKRLMGTTPHKFRDQ